MISSWLKARGVEWAAELIPDLRNLATDNEDMPPLILDEDEFEFTLEEEEITP